MEEIGKLSTYILLVVSTKIGNKINIKILNKRTVNHYYCFDKYNINDKYVIYER